MPRPADAEREAEQGGSGESEACTEARADRALRPTEDTDEREPHEDDHGAEDASGDVGVRDEDPAKNPAEHGDGDEHDREPSNEQQHAQQQAAALRDRALSRRPDAPVRGDSGTEISEVAGDERQHARGREGDEPGEHGEEDAYPERSVEDEITGIHVVSSRASETSTSRMDADSSWPMMRAATRPSRSSTRVVGVAWIGVTPAKACLTRPSVTSITLG